MANNELQNIRIKTINNISIPYSSNANSPYLVFETKAGVNGSKLISLDIAYDISNTATNYLFYFDIQGINIENNNFSPLSIQAGVFNFVPTGKEFILPPNSYVRIYAYNNNSSTTTNGSVSISVVWSDL